LGSGHLLGQLAQKCARQLRPLGRRKAEPHVGPQNRTQARRANPYPAPKRDRALQGPDHRPRDVTQRHVDLARAQLRMLLGQAIVLHPCADGEGGI
jgi:hypothetical protein